MTESLNEVERRVFGVLLEKSLAQPTYYPMTLNAIVAACNQKSNRDPMMDLDEDLVWDGLESLRQRGIVAKVLAPFSARTDRFKHEAKNHFGWEKPQRAVMAELLLRGPQTLGELRTRCSRMTPLESTQAVSDVFDQLNAGDAPLVAALPRQPGRSAVRHTHLLYPDDERPDFEIPAAATDRASSPSATGFDVAQLREQFDTMKTEIADLHAQLADLRRRVEILEERQGLESA